MKSGPIRCIAVDVAFLHVATTGDDKKLKVWKIADPLELLSERYASLLFALSACPNLLRYFYVL